MELTPAVTANKVEQILPKDKKIRAEDKPKVKIRPDMKTKDKKIRAEDKGRKSVNINRSIEQPVTKSSVREVLKPSRYIKDLMS